MLTRVDLQPAFVLHRRHYRESSLLVEAVGPDCGRIGLVARGARRPRSGLRGLLQPFVPLLLSWTQRGELGTLTRAEPAAGGALVSGRAILSALYVNELMMRLLARHDPHPELFRDYHETLARLGSGKAPEATLRVFEKRLLGAIGYALVLDKEADGGDPVVAGRSYRYVPDRGPLASPGADGVGVGVDIDGTTLLALAAERLDEPGALEQAKGLMRALLAEHLGGRPLAARRLFRPPAGVR